MSHFLLVPVGGATEGENNFAPRVEPEIIETRDGQKEHDKDEAVVDDDMLWDVNMVKYFRQMHLQMFSPKTESQSHLSGNALNWGADIPQPGVNAQLQQLINTWQLYRAPEQTQTLTIGVGHNVNKVLFSLL